MGTPDRAAGVAPLLSFATPPRTLPKQAVILSQKSGVKEGYSGTLLQRFLGLFALLIGYAQ